MGTFYVYVTSGAGTHPIEFSLVSPFLWGLSPDAYDTIVDKNTDVVLHVLDTEDYVRLSNLRVWISSVLAFEGGTFFAPYNGVDSYSYGGVFDGYDGYYIKFDPTFTFPSYETVVVSVDAYDVEDNRLQTDYEFRIEDYEPPIFYSVIPAPGADNVLETTNVVSYVYDKGSGINPLSVDININGNTAYNHGNIYPYTTVLNPWISPDGHDGYEIITSRAGDYPSGVRIIVVSTVKDYEGN